MKSVVVSPARKRLAAKRRGQKISVGGDPAHVEALERPSASVRGGLCSGRRVRDDLGEQGIEGDGDDRALDARRSPSEREVATAGSKAAERAGGRKKAGRRVFRAEANLDRVPAHTDVVLVVAEFLALGQAKLLSHQVDARHLFRDGVFDLEPGVHFEEVEVAASRRRRGTRRYPRTRSQSRGPGRAPRRPWRGAAASSRAGDGDSSISF